MIIDKIQEPVADANLYKPGLSLMFNGFGSTLDGDAIAVEFKLFLLEFLNGGD